MNQQRIVGSALIVLFCSSVFGAEPSLPPGDKEPLLRVEAGGPTSYVTALAFGPDGKTLYAAGWDKVVRVWNRNAAGQFVLDKMAYRVPIGPGLDGAINAIALSPDGRWLAVGGMGIFRGGAGFRQPGLIVPSRGGLTPEMRLDKGTILVFDTQTAAARILRGHRGPVLSMAFAPAHAGKPAYLISAAQEWDEEGSKAVGTARLWDVQKGTHIDSLSHLPDPPGRPRPGLSAWHTGNGPRQLQVAIAWEDGQLRVWDLEPEPATLRQAKDVRYNLCVAALPGGDRLLTAGYGSGNARLTRWSVATGSDPAIELQSPAPEAKIDAFPRAMALVPGSKGSPGYAAVVVRMPQHEEAYRLQLFELGDQSFGTVVNDTPLWKGSAKQPVIAVAPSGDLVAVAGNERHEVLVFGVKDLLQVQAQPQHLRGVGTTFRDAAFVRKGNDLGLLHFENPDDEAASLVFDVTHRQLSSDRDGWQIEAPAADGWRWEKSTDAQAPGVWIYRGDERLRRVALKPSQVVTAAALLAPRGTQRTPVLAMAFLDVGQPMLGLYNAETGDLFRYLAGHVDPIYSLRFSGDGRLLVSTAEDQTVCVWSLTNVGKVLGQLGQLAGVTVKLRQGKLTVDDVDEDSPARGKLSAGAVVAGLVSGGKLQPLANPREFFEAMARQKPGQEVTLRLEGGEEVALTIGQGIDERKPLFSLFVSRDGKADERQWIGWNPIGPYDSSGARAERLLGWHFNTGDATAPTRFAWADQYRKQYLREGLLKELIARGELQRLPAAAPLPAPRMTLLIQEGDQYPARDDQGQVLVRHPGVQVKVAVAGRPLESLQSVTWQIDNGAAHAVALDQATGQELTIPLTVPRGRHELVLHARTPEEPDRDFTANVALRYHPPAPKVILERPRQQIVRAAAVTVKAQVKPGQPGESLEIRFGLQTPERAMSWERETRTPSGDQPLQLEKTFQLEPGNNVIAVTAAPAGLANDVVETETSRAGLEITYVEKAPPPLIALENVVPQRAENGRSLAIEPGKPVQVSVPRVLVNGKVQAAETITQATIQVGAAGKPRPLRQFRPDQKEISLAETIELQPGSQTIHFAARTASSDEGKRTLTIEYVPALPKVVITAPARDVVLNGEQDQYPLAVQAGLTLPAEAQPFQTTVLLDDRPTGDAAVLDEKRQTLTAKVAVPAGDHRLQVQLSNRWGAVARSEPVTVHYVRPPQIVRVEGPAETQKPSIDLVAHVRSAVPLLINLVRVEVNGKLREVHAGEPKPGREAGLWLVPVPQVGLDGGEERNEIHIWVRNREADCREAGSLTTVYHPMQPPPAVQFLDPRVDTKVTTATLPVRFQITSASPVKSVQLIRDRDKPIVIPPGQLRSKADGVYEGQALVQLQSGVNPLRLEATNAGGEQSAALVVNYLHMPVQVKIDSLVVLGENGKVLEPKPLPGGKFAFPEITTGQGRLQGRVLWDQEDDERLQKTKIVRVFVNGFQQLPAILKPPVGQQRERSFQTEILLNQARGNHIEITLPDLEEDACSCTEFTVDCREPARAQRLHLVIVSAQAKNEKGLRAQLIEAFQSAPNEQGQLKTPAFEPMLLYGPQVGYYTRPEYVYPQILKIKTRIRELANAGLPSNDVVVFYYQGGEAVNAKGNLFQTDANAAEGDEESCLTCDDLVRFFADTPGAHILLFDVDRQTPPAAGGKDKVAQWEDVYPDVKRHIAVLRGAWFGQANAPHDPRLIQALGKAMPQASRLIEVTQQVQKLVVPNNRDQSYRFDQHVSGDLQALRISEKK